MMTFRKELSLKLGQFWLFSLCLQPLLVAADTIVNVQTNLGEFKLELFEDKAPATVANFLANLEAGNYQFSMVHEVTAVSFIGGRYFYNTCSEGATPVPALPAIPVEETALENSNGSIAMVRSPDDPNSVGGEWLINLGNNQNRYLSGEEPIVFGEVVEGIDIANRIADAWRVAMDISPSVPTINYNGNEAVVCGFFTADNVIKVAMQVESIDPPVTTMAANVFDAASSMLNIKVDAGADGLLALSMLLQSTEPEVIVQVQPETVVLLAEALEGMATFSNSTNNLTIPELVIEGEVAYTNLVFHLTDPENLFFTLLSFSAL